MNREGCHGSFVRLGVWQGDDPMTIRVHNLWETPSDLVERAVIDLWAREKALPPNVQPLIRVRQVLLVALDESERAVGVCTAVKRRSPLLGLEVYYYRSFIEPSRRRQALGLQLLREAQAYLAKHRGEAPEAVGVFLQITAPELKERKEAVWPTSGMVYLGKSAQGHHLRVAYFPGAHIA
jgi:GNAT superfamily N-acetyltransferase